MKFYHTLKEIANETKPLSNKISELKNQYHAFAANQDVIGGSEMIMMSEDKSKIAKLSKIFARRIIIERSLLRHYLDYLCWNGPEVY